MTEFTQDSLRQFREDFEKVVSEFALKRGISLSLGNISFSGSAAHTRLDIRLLDVTSSGDLLPIGTPYEESILASEFKQLGFTVPPKIVGATVLDRTGTKYLIQGLSTRARTHPLLLKRISDGQRSRAPYRVVREFV